MFYLHKFQRFLFCNAFCITIYCNGTFLFLVQFFSFFRQISYLKNNQDAVYFHSIAMNVFSYLFYMLLYEFLNLFFYTIGKSFLLRTIANCALDHGLNVCLSAPTGKLSSTYAHQLPMCRCNTVHSNFFIPVNNSTHPNTINWGRSDVHVLLVDEVMNYKPFLCLIV